MSEPRAGLDGRPVVGAPEVRPRRRRVARVRTRPWTRIDLAEVARLLTEERLTLRQTAERLGHRPNALSNAIAHAGWDDLRPIANARRAKRHPDAEED